MALVTRDGPAAFSARAVAAEAGLPLASVSYYYPRLDDLLGAALQAVLDHWLGQARAVAAGAVETTSGGSADVARLLASALLPPSGAADDIRTRYEHLLAAARIPAATEALAGLRPALAQAVDDILARTRAGTTVPADVLISLVDGAAVGALTEGSADPAATVRRQLDIVLRSSAPGRRRQRRAPAQPGQSSNDRPEIRS